MKNSYGYILASRTRRLYVGMTSELERRIWEHKVHLDPDSFSARYNITKLVWAADIPDSREAIAWEKRVKKWSHAKKVALIEELNPHWNDLAAEWYDPAGIERDRRDIAEAHRTGALPNR